MGDLAVGFFLIVVRRQPVIVGADEGFEEQPGTPRQPAQKDTLLVARFHHRRLPRATGVQRDFRGERPEQQQWRCRNQGERVQPEQQRSDGQRKHGRWPHLQPEMSSRATRGEQPSLVSGRSPLQQMATGHAQAPEGPHNGIEGDGGIVGQEHQREQPTPQMLAQLPQRSAHRPAAPATGQTGDQIGEQVGPRCGHREQRPDPG